MDSEPEPVVDPWAATSWQGSADATLLAGARLTLSERLDWLESAARMARRLEQGRDAAQDRRSVTRP